MSEAKNVFPLRIADAKKRIRHVFVRDLELEANIGVYKREKGKFQPVRINVDLLRMRARSDCRRQSIPTSECSPVPAIR